MRLFLVLTLLIHIRLSTSAWRSIKTTKLPAESVTPKKAAVKETASPKAAEKKALLIGSFNTVRASVLLIHAACKEYVGHSDFVEQITKGRQRNLTHQYFIADTIEGSASFCQSKIPLDLFNLCPESKCSGHGVCETVNEHTPIARVQCLCDYGYNGMFCENEIRSKTGLLITFWIIISLEAFFILLAVFRYSYQKFYDPPYRAERFVDVLKASNKHDKKARK
ncbi:unnamed protein product [Auanema sp. JU1783]|nr:unnamed protein product [Auanema sp. JU1783]